MAEPIQLFNATSFSDKEIVLKNEKELKQMYSLIRDNVNFIVKWVEGGKSYSKLIIANMLLAKVENGELVLSSRKEKVV